MKGVFNGQLFNKGGSFICFSVVYNPSVSSDRLWAYWI